ncbi:MAG: helix-turn-helix transcriptional regulator [Pseudomonadota bacterium]
MLLLELFSRFSSIGILLGVAGLILVHGVKQPISVYALLLISSTICLLITSGSPGWNLQNAGPIAIPVVIYAQFIVLFAWRFGMAVFDEEVRLDTLGISVLASFLIPMAYISILITDHFVDLGLDIPRLPAGFLLIAVQVVLMLHLVWRAFAGRGDDLVEARRKHRTAFAILIAVTLLIIVIYDSSFTIFRGIDGRLQFVLALPASLAMLLWAAKLNPETLAFIPPEKPSLAIPRARTTRDEALITDLQTLMTGRRIYREPGLTVADLASHLSIPEHQLRILINQTLGYRNFSSFLNSYRIEEAKTHLSTPSQSHIPVLTIALDVGFASISPFNNAFKSMTGQTPTSFRNTALAGPDTGSRKPA